MPDQRNFHSIYDHWHAGMSSRCVVHRGRSCGSWPSARTVPAISRGPKVPASMRDSEVDVTASRARQNHRAYMHSSVVESSHDGVPQSNYAEECLLDHFSSASQGALSSLLLPPACTPPQPPKNPSSASQTSPRPIPATYASSSSIGHPRETLYPAPFSRHFGARLIMSIRNTTRQRARSCRPAAGTSALVALRERTRRALQEL